VTSARTSLWIGTYPAAGAGSPAGLGEGIWRVELDTASGTFGAAELVAVTPSPSFVAAHPSGRVLYAVGELTAGTVTAFAVPEGSVPGQLVALDVVASGGADPCHLLLAPDARTLYVANYSSGTLGVLPLDADGLFTAEVRAARGPVQVLGHAGSGPDASRQEGPHAHFVAIAPGGQFVVVADLGTDDLRRYARDTATGLLSAAGIAATLPPGTGPRHLVFAADGRTAYVVGELDVSVADGATSVPGAWPRHFAVVDGVVVVAAQVGGVLVALRSGEGLAPRVVTSVLPLPAPACVVPTA